MAKVVKQDSNITSLSYAEEASYKVLPATPLWLLQSPNTYNDFGGSVTTTPRNPINSSRQRKKGPLTDLDASGGYESDLTQVNMQDLMQGFFFADLRRKADVGFDRQPRRAGAQDQFADFLITDIDTTGDTITVDSRVATTAAVVAGGTGYAVGDVVEVVDVNATVNARFIVTAEAAGVVTAVALQLASFTGGREGRTDTDTAVGAVTTVVTGTGDAGLTLTLTYANGLTWQVGDVLLLDDNNDLGNDGIKNVASATDNVITTVENLVTDAAPAAGAIMTTVGNTAGTSDLDVDATGTFPALTSTLLDFTSLGLVQGEWVFVGGDGATSGFANSVNNGPKRVRNILTNRLEFDKSDATMVDETGTGLDIEVYLGRALKNELGALVIRRTYQVERQLGAPDDTFPNQIQSEVLTGSVPSEIAITIPAADKIVTTPSFVAADDEIRSATTGIKAGTRIPVKEEDAFNTSSDFSRIRLAQHTDGIEAPVPLFAFAEDISFTFNNNLTPNKAISVLGSFEVTAGTFEVGGAITAYFSDTDALEAVRNNVNITLDVFMAKGPVGSKTGMIIDLPLVTLGDGRPNVEQDQAIKLPLEMDAATAALIDPNLDYTAMIVYFDFLPNVADT